MLLFVPKRHAKERNIVTGINTEKRGKYLLKFLYNLSAEGFTLVLKQFSNFYWQF